MELSHLQQVIDEQTEPWGVKVTAVEVRDVQRTDHSISFHVSKVGVPVIVTLAPASYHPVGGETFPPVPAEVVSWCCVVNVATSTESLVGMKKCCIAPESLQLDQT